MTDSKPSLPPASDPRIGAFCSFDGPQIFRSVADRHDIWREDPHDVESIHLEARGAFERLLNSATTPPGLPSGRILLLLGEAGCGKTHLMRAFRHVAHGRERGYCAYLQMTTATGDYARYVLNNLIESLDQPYKGAGEEESGLTRLSNALVETLDDSQQSKIAALRDEEIDDEALARLVDDLGDRIVLSDERFCKCDHDFVRALLYLRRDDPRIKSRVLKYLRCESLSTADRRRLGGIVPRVYGDAPMRVCELLGKLMWAIDGAALIVCVDQLEDIYNLDEAPQAFRRAIDTLRDLTERIPSSLVVVACLEDFYEKLRGNLTKSIIDRIEHDPRPVCIKGLREADEIVRIVAKRLGHLYDRLGVVQPSDGGTFPIPEADLRKLAGQRTRDILNACLGYREACAEAGHLLPFDATGTPTLPLVPTPPAIDFDLLWNDFHSVREVDIPGDEPGLAALLAEAIGAASAEVATGHFYTAEARGRMVEVAIQGNDNSIERGMIGVCDKSAKGGALARQIAELSQVTSDGDPRVIPIVVRSTSFPAATTQVGKQIEALVANGGRCVLVENSDWRAMLNFRRFADENASKPGFAEWRKQGRPLSRLKSLRMILDFDNLKPTRPEAVAPRPEPGPIEPPRPHSEPISVAPRSILLGRARDRTEAPLAIDPDELTRHAAFLGGTGSGKTTTALNVIEQLLLRGIPAILIDRKGDLCGYADLASSTPPDDPALAERHRLLQERVDVAIYTPGNPEARPLSIAVAPPGLSGLPTSDRERAIRQSAAGLAGMMGYKPKGTDQARQMVLERAIGLLAEDGEVALEALVAMIADEDPSLISAVGLLDTKNFGRLVQDLETLRLRCGPLLTARGEDLDIGTMLGLGEHARLGKTRLSVVSTKSLVDKADVQFWVSQFLVELARWTSRSPSDTLQAVVLFDEADLYLPAVGKPSTKEPMENLLKRARSAGLGVLLATQSPGDLDYKCRENVRSWFIGRIRENTALAKLKPMLSDARVDVASKLATQEAGEFYLVRETSVVGFRSGRSALSPQQASEETILRLARETRSK